MATPAAAAALFQAALPKPSDGNAAASGSGSGSGSRGRGSSRGRGVGGGRNSVGGRTARGDEDIGMSDVAESGAKRRGRQGARAGPMGERPARGRGGRSGTTSGRNSPALIRDQGTRASSTPAPSKSERPTGSTIDALKLFLLSRYTADARMLNLENMAEDPVLREHNLLSPGQKGAPSNMAGAMWKLSAEMFPNVITLSFANNSLTSLLPLSPWLLTQHLSDVENVSFANNSLSHFKDLDPFSPSVGKIRSDGRKKGWANLKELVMTGNPMAKTEGEEAQNYQVQMARRFKNLTTLDQQPIDPSIAFTASTASATSLTPGLSPSVKKAKARAKRDPVVFPVPTAPGFFESEPTRDFVGGFLTKFFPAYDDDRASLQAAYAPVCSFSFSTDTAPNVRSRAKRLGTTGDKRFPNQHKLDWKQYLTPDGSRNLTRVKYPAKRINTLKVSPETAVASISSLPKTKHPLEDPSKFIFDTWTMPGVLAPVAPDQPGETVIFAVVHGQFTELPSKGVRSFDRTFVLAPAPAGSPAQAAGWPCIILSDMLILRAYADPNVWQPPAPPAAPSAATIANGAPPTATPAPAAGVMPGQERAEGITDEQQALVLQLQSVTNLTYTFAHLCLVQNSWDPATAFTNFQALHAQGAIPPEAFVGVAPPVQGQ